MRPPSPFTRFRPRHTRFVTTACLTALALALTSCGTSEEHAAAPRPEKASITVGMLPIADNVQLKVAIDRGLFKAEGLDVKYEVQLGGSDAIPKLKSGRLDISFGAYVPFFQAHASGAIDMRIVADGSQSAPGTDVIILPLDSPIHSVQDLTGKRIGVNVTGSFTEMLVKAAVEPSGVKLTERNFVAVPFPDTAKALRDKKIDAALVPEPYSTLLQTTMGARVLVDACQGATADFPLAGYAASADWVKRYPKTLAAFQRAIVKAQRLLQDRVIIEQTVRSYTKIDQKTASILHYTVFPTTLSATRLQRVLDFMRQYGYLKDELDVKSLIAASPA